jgi:hypothetical protein
MTAPREFATVLLPYRYETVPQAGENPSPPAFRPSYPVNRVITDATRDAFRFAGFIEVSARPPWHMPARHLEPEYYPDVTFGGK